MTRGGEFWSLEGGPRQRLFNGFLVGGLLGAFAVAPLSNPYEVLVVASHVGLGQTLFSLLASHAVAFGAGFLAGRTSGLHERFVAAGSVWVGAVLLASAGLAERAAGLPTAFTPILVGAGSWAAFALLGGALARRRRSQREGRSASY
ncbi:MAG: hypothetical protein M3R38_38835 [Actinomycetota bacterium]|nr:hypothetical protein [Actinomycetota bacterium]